MEKLAIIEIREEGTSLSVVSVSNQKYKIEKRDLDRIDYYDEIKKEKLLKPTTITKLLNVFKIYKRIAESFGAEKIIALASDFLMEARNQKGFLDEVYNNTNITFSYISNDEIVKSYYTSVVNSIDCTKGCAFDIGVSKIVFARYNRRTIVGSFVLPFGTISCLTDEKGKKRTFEEIEEFTLQQLQIHGADFTNIEDVTCVGTGEAFVDVGRLAKKIERYPLAMDNNYTVTNETFDKTIAFIKDLDLEKAKRVKNVMAPNPDILLAELAIASAIYKFFGVKEMTISTANFFDGYVRNFIGIDSIDRYADLLATSFEFCREFMPVDTNIGLRVSVTSSMLFKQLKVMHKLPRSYAKVLRVASYMHDSGKAISYDNYEKHGFYMIMNSNLAGVSQKDLLLAAFTCLCQRADNFNLADWVKYQAIVTDEDLDAVRKLGAIVKLASSLNCSKDVNVTDVICDMLGDSVIMKTVSNNDATYEVIQGQKLIEDYRKLFKKNLQII